MLGISNAKFTPEYTELTAFVRIILPQINAAGKQEQLFLVQIILNFRIKVA